MQSSSVLKVSRGGPIELEQMGSADPPLAVHCLYGGRDRQLRRRGKGEVYRLGGPHGGAPARLAPVHRSVLVRAAVCRELAQRATRPAVANFTLGALRGEALHAPAS